MQTHITRACGKALLVGEHAVVYGQPALGVPLTQLFAEAHIHPGHGNAIIIASDLNQTWALDALPDTHAIAHIIRATLMQLGIAVAPNFVLTLQSSIPIARGLGSGTALSTVIVRALAAFYSATLTPAQISALVYETEKLYHGTPSGVDNTIIAYEQPVYFRRAAPAPPTITPLHVARPFTLVVGDTGVPSETKVAVGDVRAAWQREPERYEKIFGAIGALVAEARQMIETGALETLGPLLDANQTHLRALDVSSPDLEHLIAAAKQAGALGAKLSGGGRGGCMIALVDASNRDHVAKALRRAGAQRVFVTTIAAHTPSPNTTT